MAKRPTTRDRLVDAARDLFWAQGYHSTGIAQILERADANSGSLYHFFPTKEDLLSAVLEGYERNIGPWLMDPLFARVHDPIERIFGLLDGYRQGLMQSNYEQGCPIGNLALEVSSTHPNARRLIARNFDAWRAAIRRCLEEAAGRLPAEVDRDQLAAFVLTTMEGAVMLARSYRNLEAYDAAVSQLRDLFERLVQDGTTWSAPRRGNGGDVPPERRYE